MSLQPEIETPPSADKASAGAVRLMVAILVAMALLAVYTNVQRARRATIETVEVKMIAPASSPSATTSPSS